MNSVRLDTKKMSELREALRVGSNWRVKVGCLGGGKAGRWGPGSGVMNNPSLGAVHEFGSKLRHIPARSFLRVPLLLKLPERIDQIGRDVWRSLVLNRGLTEALRLLGVLGEQIVQEAFATGGFGQWAPLSPRYARWKMAFTRQRARKAGLGPVQIAILILSAQLRKSVTSRVVFKP